MIREEDPPKPSLRLSDSEPILPKLADSRHTDVRRLGSRVRGELDWIVMKSLEKDRKRRYETPTQMAADIVAHLDGKPILAAPPSTFYKLQKFVKRNRTAVLAAVSILLFVTVGGGFYIQQRFVKQDLENQNEISKLRAEAAEQEAKLAKLQNEALIEQNAASEYVGVSGRIVREQTRRPHVWPVPTRTGLGDRWQVSIDRLFTGRENDCCCSIWGLSHAASKREAH